MKDLSIIYYTSSREDEIFAEKVRKYLLKVIGRTFLISVSQKPLDFGENICVGNIGFSEFSIFKQMRIGIERATTKYIALVEADSLYPEEHFKFHPTKQDRIFYNKNVFILNSKTLYFAKLSVGFYGGIISNRSFILNVIKIMSESKKRCTFRQFNFDTFKTKFPILTVDHNEGLHAYTHPTRGKCQDLPLWGNAKNLLKELGLLQ